MRKKKNGKSRLDEILEIPDEVSTGLPKITIMGFEKAFIENHKGILEYQDFFVRLNTNIGIININGFNLKLEDMTKDDLMITGRIDSVDFESIMGDENEEE